MGAGRRPWSQSREHRIYLSCCLTTAARSQDSGVEQRYRVSKASSQGINLVPRRCAILSADLRLTSDRVALWDSVGR